MAHEQDDFNRWEAGQQLASQLILDAVNDMSSADTDSDTKNAVFNSPVLEQFIHGCEQLLTDTTAPDVIYIDPMYPDRKKSALVKKDMQILQRLHGKDENTAELLDSALKFAKKRVVVKRPVQAETLSQKKPNTCIKSKKTRYDIYTIEKM